MPGDDAHARSRPSTVTRRGEAAERRRVEQDLRQAIARDGFSVHYQPRVALADGSMATAEALLRLPTRRRGLMPPAVVLPAAAQGQLGEAVAAWLLRAACLEAAAWPSLAGGAPAVPAVSVNLPAGSLHDGSILRHLAAALEASALPPERLELELTESMLLAPDADVLLTLSAIRDLGVGLLVDDFGLALASLATLRHLPLTGLKLDRCLVRDIARDAEDRAVARSITASAHALHVRVAAEGVETVAQRDALLSLGCDEAQGSLFSHPVTGAQLMALLAPRVLEPAA